MQEELVVHPERNGSTATVSVSPEFIVPFGVLLAEEALPGNPTNTAPTSTHTYPTSDHDTDTD